MKVQLRTRFAVNADDVWDAIRKPVMFRKVSAPLLEMRSLEPGGFPAQWLENAPHRVGIFALGVMPSGVQTIDVSYRTTPDGTRVMTDAGTPQSGALTVITSWRHRMAVTALPDGTTLYRDRLDFDAGLLSPLVWLSLWSFWQWRAFRLRRLLQHR